MKRFALLACLWTVTGILGASGYLTWFPLSPALNAYSWEIRSTVNRFELQTANKAPSQYPWNDGFTGRSLVNVQLGAEIPLVGADDDRFLWYLGFPVSADMLMDMFERDSSPIINTDYWFGIRIEGVYTLDLPWPHNVALRLLPLFHESTHIGDEFAFRMMDQNSTGYYRINVSYEAWEITVGLDEWKEGMDRAFNIRLGLSGLWSSHGYYREAHSSEIGTQVELDGGVHLSRRSLEPFVQINYVESEFFPSFGNWIFQPGMELRNRIRFDYFSTHPEKRVWSIDTTLGWYHYPPNGLGRRLGFYLKLYGGQYPHGQFRESDGYLVFGSGLSLGL